MCPPSPPYIQYIIMFTSTIDSNYTHTHVTMPVIFILHSYTSIIIDTAYNSHFGYRRYIFFSKYVHKFISGNLFVSLYRYLSYSETCVPFDHTPHRCVFRDILCGHVLYQSLGIICSFLYRLEIINMW